MKYSRKIYIWLFIGLIMVFIQVVVGGITRLTESGLSITKWEVVKGTLPPLSESEWQSAFELYKTTPQYKEINEGMSLGDFKFIYFWEYIHRFWARIMGFVFIIPFCWFWFKGYFDRALIRKLSIVMLLSVLAATFGWIMVASGLINRPWVNAYKLSLHLCIAFSVYGYLLWVMLTVGTDRISLASDKVGRIKKLSYIFFALLIVQIFLGGVMSGMKAAVIFPTWPDMNGSYIPAIVFDVKEWTYNNFNQYDSNLFMPALIHFLHRSTAYLLFITGCYFTYRLYKLGGSENISGIRTTGVVVFSVLLCQVILGIVTVMSSVGHIPVLWGVLHQAFALLLLTGVIYTIFIFEIKN